MLCNFPTLLFKNVSSSAIDIIPSVCDSFYLFRVQGKNVQKDQFSSLMFPNCPYRPLVLIYSPMAVPRVGFAMGIIRGAVARLGEMRRG